VALFRTFSAAIQGIDAHVVDVEVDMYPAGTQRDFVTVGMPDAAVKESRERIKSALLNSGFGYPSKSVTINLAPANIRKEGAGFDLPMATAILGAMGLFGSMEEYMVVGELSLDGSLRPIRGALSKTGANPTLVRVDDDPDGVANFPALDLWTAVSSVGAGPRRSPDPTRQSRDRCVYLLWRV